LKEYVATIYFICRSIIFILVYAQEQMLKKGCAWHYTAYDQRPELAKVSSTDRCHRANLITCDRKREIFLRPFNLLLRFGNVVVPTQKNILRPVQIVCLKDINSRMEGVNHKTHLNFLSLSGRNRHRLAARACGRRPSLRNHGSGGRTRNGTA
jgi:hypothetical protein